MIQSHYSTQCTSPCVTGAKRGREGGGGGRTKYYGEKGKGSLLNLLLVTVKNKSISLL